LELKSLLAGVQCGSRDRAGGHNRWIGHKCFMHFFAKRQQVGVYFLGKAK
jgi:hypothetical protein